MGDASQPFLLLLLLLLQLRVLLRHYQAPLIGRA